MRRSSDCAAPVLRVLRGVPAPLLTVRAAAEALGVSTATLYALVRARELPHIRLTRNGIRLRPQDVAEFIATRFQARSAPCEHRLHTVGVAGSSPAAPNENPGT
jgi:excisionase family DNA binding protein